MLKDIIREKAQAYGDQFITIRRHLHAHPELSYKEFETSAYIAQMLNDWGIPFTKAAGTGLIGTLKGKNPDSRIIALRADMDALPILEQNDVSYKSQNPGVMHACGHDVHTAVLLGATKILKELKDQWEGTIRLLFQPGEEKNPGGASLMIKDGALENPKPQGIIGLHTHPGLDCGLVSFRKGRIMASADEIYFTIKGQGGHAASPHLTTDTILVASQLIIALQQIISRNRPPLNPSILSICSIHGGDTTNVIPSEVKLLGTFRAMDEQWRFQAHELIKRTARGIAEATNAEIIVEISIGYPCVDNNPELTDKAWLLAERYMGRENVQETEVRMGAEDFGFYSQQIPGCFFRLGVKNDIMGFNHVAHTPVFNADEKSIPIGMGLMAYLATNIHF